MSFFVFPRQNKPQFFFSDSVNVAKYFADNFLFSKKAKIQGLINITKSVLSDTAWRLLFKLALHKEKLLPDDLSNAVEYSKEFIRNNKELFLSQTVNDYEITFIIRKASWQRRSDKFIIIFFLKGGKEPFAVVKGGSSEYKISIESEFMNTMTVYNKFGKDKFFTVPEPLSFHAVNDSVMYFERPVSGLPVNNYLKLIKGDRRKLDLFLDILGRCENILLKFNTQVGLFNYTDFMEYFYKPIEDFKKTERGRRYSLKLDELINYCDTKLRDKLPAVWMHGDLWGGSILFGEDKISIIDWEFFTERGVLLWDFFSIAFHAGESFNKGSSDFLTYFESIQFAEKVDNSLLNLADNFKLDKTAIPFMFQTYLLYNIHKRDTNTEHYWQECLEYYWNIPDIEKNRSNRLL